MSRPAWVYSDGSFAGGDPANGPKLYHTVRTAGCPSVGDRIVTDNGSRREVVWTNQNRTGFETMPALCVECEQDNMQDMACPNDSIDTCADCCPCHSE